MIHFLCKSKQYSSIKKWCKYIYWQIFVYLFLLHFLHLSVELCKWFSYLPFLKFHSFIFSPQIPHSATIDPSHPSMQQGVHVAHLGNQSGQLLHHRSLAQHSRQLQQTGSNLHSHSELSFNPSSVMEGQPGGQGAADVPEPSLEVSPAILS